MRTRSPLVAPVFRSDGQARLLSELLLSREELTLSDAARRAGVAYATAHGEIDRLLSAGIVKERRAGRTRLISADFQSPLAGPLREILLVSTGPAVLLSEELGTIKGVRWAFLYGSFAARSRGVDGQSPRDVDVMVVGTPDADAVYEACARVERVVGRPVNPTILTEDEFGADSGFLRNVRSNPIVPLIGGPPWPS